MGARNIWIVYRKELREALRDRRTLISALLVPLILFPLLTAGLGYAIVQLAGKAKEEVPDVMIIGGDDSPQVIAGLENFGKIRVVPTHSDWKQEISDKAVRAAVEIPPGFQKDIESEKPATVKIYMYQGEMKSGFAADRVDEFFRTYRESVVRQRLTARNLPEDTLKPFEIKQENVAPPEKVGGAAFGGLIGYMVILMCFTGGMYPGIDLTAGEKERGTMETILSSPISRVHLVLGKFLLVLTASLTTAAMSVTSMGVSFWVLEVAHAFDKAGADAATLQLQIKFSTVLSIFVMVLPLAVLFAAAIMTVALTAKSYKEAQSYITPMMMAVIVPAVAAMLPVDLSAKLALIPVLNASLLCKELVTGTYHWNFIAIIFISTCAYAAAALFLAVKMFQREDVLFRS